MNRTARKKNETVGNTVTDGFDKFFVKSDNSDFYIGILAGKLKRKLGFDISFYRKSHLRRRLYHRIRRLNLDSVRQYLEYIGNHPEELVEFKDVMTIHVTEFFRDITPFRLVEDKIMGIIASRKKEDEPIRILSAPCSTGEEAYSFAIIGKFLRDRGKIKAPVEVYGCDIEEKAIELAKEGIYPKRSLKNISEVPIARNFTRITPGYYKIKEQLRKMTGFFVHDLFQPLSLGSKFDLISCRNFLIYVEKKKQKKILDNLTAVLNPGGFIILGKTEGFALLNENEFEPFSIREHIYIYKP